MQMVQVNWPRGQEFSHRAERLGTGRDGAAVSLGCFGPMAEAETLQEDAVQVSEIGAMAGSDDVPSVYWSSL